MPIIIYLFLLVFLLVLIVLLTSIVLTLKFNFLDQEERKEFGGTFTIKWLLFSHTFSIEDLNDQKPLYEEPQKSKTEFEQREYRSEDLSKTESKISAEKRREIGEKTSDENEKVTFSDREKKTGLIDKIRGKKEEKKEEKKEVKVETEKEMGMTTREKLHWGLQAFKYLRKPVLHLFSDMLRGIKIKRLNSCMTFGLADPADTGVLCGFIHAVVGFIYSRCNYCDFSINPVFMNPILDFRGDAEISVKIHSMIFPFIKFIFNRNTLSFTYSLVKELFQKKWESEWRPKWISEWKSKMKSNS